ncbi:HAD-IA family hydrolase [Acidipropionibacterium acidipropionici]|uniref:HAD-IA family hydrolase n=1 Tax=Acidipropionibacterium acidipropionici TaxID=1748 RepID=UPI0004134054|nr:HAD-IA family hydrolase [Acidipropionibacterium acidipropionici]ALN15996.1 methyltransferase [Acidipropionibacterium acidipropionici]APZ08257.1 methyltransferase [Acidipropionibacterium acidipropionici]
MRNDTPSAVLWDFDGTLVDTEPRWMEAETAIVTSRGGAWSDEQGVSFIGTPLVEVTTAMSEALEGAITPAQAETLLLDQVIAYHRERPVPWCPGSRELLEEVRAAQIPCALVTGSTRSAIEPLLEHFPEGLFDTVITYDDLPPEQNKPAPQPYLLAASRLGVDAADCLVIEDSASGARAGNGAGATVVALDGPATPPPAPDRVHVHNLSGIRLPDLVKLWNLAHQPAAAPAQGGGGVLRPGERVTLTDPKGRRHSLVLVEGGVFHTTKGAVRHDDLIGGPQGVVVTSAGGMDFLAMRPILSEFTVTMPREAAVVYPKEAAQIVMWADIFPGARVLEAGVGSGGLTIPLLRAIGPHGRLTSYERRPEFAEVARTNVEAFYGRLPQNWRVELADLATDISPEPVDRAVLDMLAPWECVEVVGDVLVPGGVLCCYVATTTQMGRVMDTLRAAGGWTEPQATETTVRDWHAEGLAIRPSHGATGHTGFLVIARRLAPGVTAPMRKRRPAPGAYGPDYHGPRPRNISEHDQWRPAKEDR